MGQKGEVKIGVHEGGSRERLGKGYCVFYSRGNEREVINCEIWLSAEGMEMMILRFECAMKKVRLRY